jgi:DNA mismatch repair protein MutL
VEAHGDTLRGVGYDVEPFGGGSVRIRAIPPLLAGRDPAAALQAMLRDLLEREAAQWLVADARDRLAATLACHSAVRAGQPLPVETMSAIVRDLSAAAHPRLCPHGRPTLARIPRGDVSRWFGRSGWGRA